jgi:hypothetical protein
MNENNFSETHASLLSELLVKWTNEDFEKSHLLPVLMDFVELTCCMHSPEADNTAVDVVARLAVQAQRVWETVDYKRCCNYRFLMTSTDDFSPLHRLCDLDAASQDTSGRAALVLRKLLENNAQVNRVCSDGATPLYMACRTGNLGAVNNLLEFNAEVDKKSSPDFETPLVIAIATRVTQAWSVRFFKLLREWT